MSVQFGKWTFDGKPVAQDYLEKVRASIAPYGPDDSGSYVKNSIGILYGAFHTTNESRRETQPHVMKSGAVITWDGRLDNREELIRSLRRVLDITSTDVSIVAAAYEEWGTDCLAKLTGDWALSIWDANTRSLILAKDPIGVRHLYYSLDKDQVTWSTILDPLVLFGGKSFSLCEEYIAGCFSFSPAVHLTPYVGIHSVLPSSSVAIRAGKHSINTFWNFHPDKRIRCRSDAEYEEHFRMVFAESVRRRLRSDSPILAELSGGMDSSSIVCIADTLIAQGITGTPRLDTISYYNDSEPNWNERPYFTRVEKKRGCAGCHIDVSPRESFIFDFDTERFAATPGVDNRSKKVRNQFAAYTTSHGNRVVLSGIGGDEVMGGVPTPTPELCNLVATGQLAILARQLKLWALNKRKPWCHLLFEAIRGFLPPAIIGAPKHKSPVPWLNATFVKHNRAAVGGYETRLKLWGSSPSFQANLRTLAGLQRQLGSFVSASEPPYEKLYPYLDRDLLEFIYAIPREQLVRPGQRRSLMRRALVGIVPEEVLNRSRKAFVARAPMAAIVADWPLFADLTRHMLSSSLGMVDNKAFLEVLRQARCGQEIPLLSVMRTLAVESWLRKLNCQNALYDPQSSSKPQSAETRA